MGSWFSPAFFFVCLCAAWFCFVFRYQLELWLISARFSSLILHFRGIICLFFLGPENLQQAIIHLSFDLLVFQLSRDVYSNILIFFSSWLLLFSGSHGIQIYHYCLIPYRSLLGHWTVTRGWAQHEQLLQKKKGGSSQRSAAGSPPEHAALERKWNGFFCAWNSRFACKPLCSILPLLHSRYS